MNQTQIAYFKEKVKSALRRVLNSIEEQREPDEYMSYGEKAAQIQSGKARFRIEEFSGPHCPRDSNDLFKFFDFDDEDAMTSRNDQRRKGLTKLQNQAQREADRIETAFVLEKLKDPAKALDDFIGKYDK